MRRFTVLCMAALLLPLAAITVGGTEAAHAADLPSLTIGDVSVWEGDAASATVAVPVDLSAPSATIVKVQYAAAWGTADSGDLRATNGTLTFGVGVTTKDLKIAVYGDTTPETDEHMTMTLSNPIGATIAKGSGGVTVLDDDTNPDTSGLEVSVGDVAVIEANAGHHIARIPVTLSAPAPSPIQIAYTLQCGTAQDGPDYSMATKGTITFPTGARSKTLTFAVAANTIPENAIKKIVQKIVVKKGPAVVGESVGDGFIIDNDNGSTTTPTTPLDVGELRRVSVTNDGSEATAQQSLCGIGGPLGSRQSLLSANGRYVAFTSDASNLVPDDTNFATDVFVRDLVNNTTERVSLQNDGSQFVPRYSVYEWAVGSRASGISADGRYVTFYYSFQLYLRDRVAGTTEMVSATPAGQPGNGSARASSTISADGRYVAFVSAATDLDPNNIFPMPRVDSQWVYLRDRVLHTTQLITHDGSDYGATISGDGRYIAFTTSSPGAGVLSGDTNNCGDTFVYDRVTGTTERVSVASDGTQQVPGPIPGCSGYGVFLSYDGRFVEFASGAANLVPFLSFTTHVFVHDRSTGETDLVDQTHELTDGGPWMGSWPGGISDDGRYVLWSCPCGESGIVGGFPVTAMMWEDRSTGALQAVAQRPDGTTPYIGGLASMSSDGSIVAFEALDGANIVPNDANDVTDVFVQRIY